jgi:peptide deformylase
MALKEEERIVLLSQIEALATLPIVRIPGILNGQSPEEASILYKKSREVAITPPGLRQAGLLIRRMERILGKYREITGVGRAIAANQVGSDLAVTIFLTPEGKFLHYINPKILKASEEENIYWEMCLSGAPLGVDVMRPAEIKVSYYKLDGQEYIEDLKGFDARRMQHEIEHLNGGTCYNSKGANVSTLGYQLEPSIYMKQDLRPVKD